MRRESNSGDHHKNSVLQTIGRSTHSDMIVIKALREALFITRYVRLAPRHR